jgi:hypothetical protein
MNRQLALGRLMNRRMALSRPNRFNRLGYFPGWRAISSAAASIWACSTFWICSVLADIGTVFEPLSQPPSVSDETAAIKHRPAEMRREEAVNHPRIIDFRRIRALSKLTVDNETHN